MSHDGSDEGAERRGPSVFFSYSRADWAMAQPIVKLLEDNGFAVWWDGKLEAGVKYVESTEQALETAQAVVVAWSATSTGSHWVRDEAMSGRDRACLVPLTLDGSLPPLGFRQFQVLDFSGWKGKPGDAAAQELLRATAALHAGAAAPAAPLTPVSLARPLVVNRRRGLLYFGLGAGVIASGAAGWALLRGDGAGAANANSIAVLPFTNDSGNAKQDYLSAGLASELRSMLARNQALRVVARSSSEVVRERGLDAVAAARELGVAFIVEGSVRVVGDGVRVSADLIDGETGIGRLSKTYDETLDGLLGMQESLAQAISSAISTGMGAASAALRLGEATVPAAYDEYLRGWDLFIRSSDTATDLAVLAHFQNAARLDSGFAGARAGEAAAFLALGHTAESSSSAATYYGSAVASARAALALGPDLAEAHSVLAQTLFEAQLKVREARAPYEKSLENGGGSASIQTRYAEYQALTGRHEAATRAVEQAVMLDPLNPSAAKVAGLAAYAVGDYQRAIASHRRALELDAAIGGSHGWIGYALLQTGELQSALGECAAEPLAAMKLAGEAIIQQKLGDEAAAAAALAQLAEEYGDAAAYQQAQVLAQWGDKTAALEKLVLARELGDAGLTYLLIDPLLEPLRTRTAFRNLLQELGFS